MLKYETDWLFTVISKEPKFGQPVSNQRRNNTLTAKLPIQHLPLPLGQAFNKHDLTHNSFPLPGCEFPESGYPDFHTAFQNRLYETQEVSRVHTILLQRVPADTRADSRARGRGGRLAEHPK